MSAAVYTRTARLLHWTVAALVLGLLVVGTAMVRIGDDVATTVALYQAHKSFGLTVFVLMLVRLVWRWQHAPPVLTGEIGALRQRLAAIAHGTIYVLLLALPVTGWLSASAAPIPFPFLLFGLVDVPHLPALAEMPYDARMVMFERLALAHRWLAWGLGLLIALHAGGALWPAQHRRMVLPRMWPGVRR